MNIGGNLVVLGRSFSGLSRMPTKLHTWADRELDQLPDWTQRLLRRILALCTCMLSSLQTDETNRNKFDTAIGLVTLFLLREPCDYKLTRTFGRLSSN
jgi:hypothetical protein